MSTRRGFILPTTLMVMTLLTVMLSAAFVMVSAEFRASDNVLALSRANSLAQAGLQDYFSRNRALAASATYDSLHIAYGAGYTDVVATRLVPASGTKLAIWLVRSTGTVTGSLLTGQVQAQRTVAEMATFNPGVLPVKAVFVAANPVQFTGINGNPQQPFDASDACATTPDTAQMVAWSNDISGNTNNITIRYGATEKAVLDSTHVDWSSLVAGNFTPDYNVPPFPSAAAMSSYPILYSSGNLSMAANFTGKGILVVKGDLVMGSSDAWDGIILVGGRYVSPPNLIGVDVEGAMVTGLNNQTSPGSVGIDSISKGNPGAFHWNSCEVTKAAASQGSLAPLRHTFMDTWAAY